MKVKHSSPMSLKVVPSEWQSATLMYLCVCSFAAASVQIWIHFLTCFLTSSSSSWSTLSVVCLFPQVSIPLSYSHALKVCMCIFCVCMCQSSSRLTNNNNYFLFPPLFLLDFWFTMLCFLWGAFFENYHHTFIDYTSYRELEWRINIESFCSGDYWFLFCLFRKDACKKWDGGF